MTDHDLDALLRASAPVDDIRLDDPAVAASLADLSRAITTTSQDAATADHPHTVTSRTAPTPWWRRRAGPRRTAVAACAFAVLVTATGIGLNERGGFQSRPATAWAAEAVRFANGSPRLLISGNDYVVVRADQATHGGEMGFARRESPKQELQATWYEDGFSDRVQSLAGDGSAIRDLGTTTVLGRDARWFHYIGSDRFVAVWAQDGKTIEFDGTAGGKAGFVAVLDRLATVDVDTWLRAMPESVVKPDGVAAASKEILSDVPLPPKWGEDGLKLSTGVVRDRYQLGASVLGGVACGWIREWHAAKAAGDSARVQAAARAMASSRDWKMLREMDADGDYPEVVWGLADVMHGGLTRWGSGDIGDYRASLDCVYGG